MSGLFRRLVELLRPSRLDRESVEEINHHVEMLVERGLAAGLDEREARRRALAEAGSIQAAREAIAEERTGVAVDRLWRELVHAFRVVRRAPGLSLLSILTIGAGIGASALLFTLVNGVVLQRLPYPDPERLVRIFDVNTRSGGGGRAGAASGNINDWRARAPQFDGIAGYYAMGRTLTIGGESAVMLTAQVTAGFFDVMAVPPLLGRTFTDAETARATFNSAAAPTGADSVVVISARLWRDAFANDPGVIGRTVDLERRPFRIVGVMPDGFTMPEPRADLWMPWHIPAGSPRDQHYLGAVGRLKPGISIAEAEAQLDAVAARLGEEHPETNLGWEVTLAPLADEIVGEAGTVLWILLGSVALVSLIGCANVSLLALIRALDRMDETAVRLALGASSARLLRESLLESVLIAGAGGIVGLTIASAGVRVLPAVAPDLPRLDEVRLETATLVFIAAATLATGALAGFPQAWRRARGVTFAGLAAGAMRTIGRPRRHAAHDAIVVAQVALSVVLLAGSGLLVRSFMELRATVPGFDPGGVVVAPVFLDNQKYTTGEHTRTYYRSLFERLSAIPGVVAVGAATTVPTSPLGPDFQRPVWPEGDAANGRSSIAAAVRMITPGYLDAMGMRLADGRGFDDRDHPKAPLVIMVSEALARRLWPGERAVGKRLVVDYSTSGTYPYEIVGVVGDVRFRGPRSQPLAEIYIPHAQRPYLVMNVVVKAAGDPAAVMPLVRDALKAVDPQKPAHGLYLLTDLLGATYARDRQAMMTLLAFAAAAVLLCALGIYGVLSQRVRERTREIGIRMALGADAARLVRWIVGTALRLIGAGLAAGALVAWMATRSLDALLFGVSATDAATAVAVILVITLLGLAATVIPSWRAARIDPVVVLRRGGG